MSFKSKCNSSTNNEPTGDTSILKEAKNAHQQFQKLVAERVNKLKSTYTAEQAKILEQTKKVENLKVTALTNYSLVTEYSTNTSHELHKLRKLSQSIYEVNTDAANTRKWCEQCRNQCKMNLSKLIEQLDDFKLNSKKQLSAEEDMIENIQIEIDKNERFYISTLGEMKANINTSKIILQSEEKEIENIKKEYANACEEESVLGINLDRINKSNDDLLTECFEKNKIKESIFTDMNRSLVEFEKKINDFKAVIEDTDVKYQDTNEQVGKLQEEQSGQNQVIEQLMASINEAEEQLCSYNEHCIQLETEINESEENFMQEKNKFKDTECITKKEQNYEEALVSKQQLETDLCVAEDELQLQLDTNASLEIEIEEQQTTFNDLLVNEPSAIQSLTMEMPCIYNELVNLQAKLNDVEMKNVQRAIDDQHELSKIENDAQIALEDINDKCNKVSEEINLLEREAEMKMAEEDKQYNARRIEYETQLEHTLRECDECLGKINQGEIDLQSKLLECDILARKVKFDTALLTQLTNNSNSKNTLFRTPPAHRKRQVDYMSDSSLEGVAAIDEFLRNKKAREQRKLAKSLKKSVPSK